MEEFAFLCSRQETVDDLRLKIHYTTLELEAVKAKANEEININTESVNQLLQLLKLVCLERDEARDQIQKLLNKITPFSSTYYPIISDCLVIHQVPQHHQNSLVKPAKANPSIEESNSLSDAYNHSSSQADSLFHPVTSPDFTNINMNNTIIQNHRMWSNGYNAMHSQAKMDNATLMMENMIKGKALPHKGKLLQAVMEVGPLLQTLLVTEPFTSRQGRMVATCTGSSNLGPVEKRQKF